LDEHKAVVPKTNWNFDVKYSELIWLLLTNQFALPPADACCLLVKIFLEKIMPSEELLLIARQQLLLRIISWKAIEFLFLWDPVEIAFQLELEPWTKKFLRRLF
jgi:hypothetical protein